MNWLGLVIVGVIALICAYYLTIGPPPVKMLLNIVGWICVAVGLILFAAGLLGVPVAFH